MKKRNYIALYTLIFAVMSAAFALTVYLNGKTQICNFDGDGQHIKALVYYSEWIRSILKNIFVDHKFEFPCWSFSIGYGADIPTSLHYYAVGDPFAIFCVFFPAQHMRVFYELSIYLRLWCAGLAFSYFCFGKKDLKMSYCSVMAGAFTYIFCAFALVNSVKHIFFLTPMVFLPLVLIGVDRLLEKKCPWVFIFAVFFSAVSSFYFFYMIVFITVLYAAFEMFIPLKGFDLKKILINIGALAGYAIIGVMMSAILLLPVILSFSGDSRTENKVIFNMLYPLSYYENFLSGFLSFHAVEDGEWANLGYASPALIAVFLLYKGKTEDAIRKRLRIAFAVFTLFFMFPIVQYVFNGMSYPSARWHFGYSLLVAYILTHVWPDLTKISKKTAIFLAIGLGAYLAACMILPLSRTLNAAIQIGVAGITVLVIFLISRKEGGKKHKAAEIFALTACIASIAVNSVFGFIEFFDPNIAPTMLDQSQVKNSIEPEEAAIIAENTDRTKFSRYTYVDGDIITACNDAMMYGLTSTGYYMSMVSPAVSQSFAENLVELKMVSRFLGPDSRTALEALGSVRYVIANNPALVPYGYEKVMDGKGKNTGKNYSIYENKNPLPLGYTYDMLLSREKYEAMEVSGRQEAMIQGVVLDGYDNALGFKKDDVTVTGEKIKYTVSGLNGIVKDQDGSFVALSRNATINLTVKTPENCETYLGIKGMRYMGISEYQALQISGKWDSKTPEDQKRILNDNRYYVEPTAQMMTVKTIGGSGISMRIFNFVTRKYQRYNGRTDFFINTGFSTKSKNMITITLPERGKYTFDEIYVFCQPMTNYDGQVKKLSENVLENVDLHQVGTSTSRVSGTITLDKAKILCLSIPYSKGWTAYVDGKQTRVYQANSMFMGLPLEAGTHEITLVYQTPGGKIGAGLTEMGIAACLMLYVVRRKKAMDAKAAENKK
ncbi:MAG: YfhO family protein [Clostridiales bacterium]|nr:YfhO family protein [Clostridiales bacterium]